MPRPRPETCPDPDLKHAQTQTCRVKALVLHVCHRLTSYWRYEDTRRQLTCRREWIGDRFIWCAQRHNYTTQHRTHSLVPFSYDCQLQPAPKYSGISRSLDVTHQAQNNKRFSSTVSHSCTFLRAGLTKRCVAKIVSPRL